MFKLKHNFFYNLFFNKGNIVFVHGYNSCYNVHTSFFNGLYKLGYNIYSFNLPNHGDNIEYKEQLSFFDYCKFVIDFIKKNKLDKKLILIGHSMGGGIVSIIQNDFNLKQLKKVILLDPLNPSIGWTSKISKVISMIFSGKIMQMKSFTETKNPTMQSLKLLSEINSKKVFDEIDLAHKKSINHVLVLFGKEDDIIEPKNSEKYFTDLNKNNYKFCWIENAKHSPDIQNTNDTIDIINKYIKNKND